jgi:hypothetical protein
VTGKQLIFVQFHTAFATDTMVFPKKELDGAYNKGQASFAEDFALTVKLDACNNLPEPSWARAGSNGWEAESKHQHALYMSLSYHNRLATSHRYVANIMKRLCPECKVFRQGDAIYNPAQHKNCRSLYYVENNDAKSWSNGGLSRIFGQGHNRHRPGFGVGKRRISEPSKLYHWQGYHNFADSICIFWDGYHACVDGAYLATAWSQTFAYEGKSIEIVIAAQIARWEILRFAPSRMIYLKWNLNVRLNRLQY